MKPELDVLLAARLRAHEFQATTYELHQNFAAILRIASREGRAIKITKHGYPVALLQPLGVPVSE